jgi:hypothetical protein
MHSKRVSFMALVVRNEQQFVDAKNMDATVVPASA